MRAESFGAAHAVSPKGAMGLMQIMRTIWASLRQRYRLEANPCDAHDNIIAGAAYLREPHDRCSVPGFLAAHNAGPARWEDHLATGWPLPMETQVYVAPRSIVGGNVPDDAVPLASVVRAWARQHPCSSHVRRGGAWTRSTEGKIKGNSRFPVSLCLHTGFRPAVRRRIICESFSAICEWWRISLCSTIVCCRGLRPKTTVC